MAFVLVIAGLLMIVTGAKGTYAQFGAQLAKDVAQPYPLPDGRQVSFLYWIASIIAVGSIGYIEALREFSRLFMALIIIVMVLSNRGLFAQITKALQQGPVAPASVPSDAIPSQGTTQNPTTKTPGFVESLKKPGGGGFWDFIGAPGVRQWLFGQ
jgi:hypothetical protein